MNINNLRGSSSHRSERKLYDFDSSDWKPPSRPGRRRQESYTPTPDSDTPNNSHGRHTFSSTVFTRSSTGPRGPRGPRVAKLDQDEPFDDRPVAPPTRKMSCTQERTPSPPQLSFINANKASCNDSTLHHRNTFKDHENGDDIRINETLPAMEEESTYALDLDDASSSMTIDQATTSTPSMELLVSKLYALNGPGPSMPAHMHMRHMQQVPLYPAVSASQQTQSQSQKQKPPLRLLDYNDRSHSNSNSTTSDLSSGTGAWCWSSTTSNRSDSIRHDNDDSSENNEQVGHACAQFPRVDHSKEECQISNDQHLKQAPQQQQQQQQPPSDTNSYYKQATAASRPYPDPYPEPFYSIKQRDNSNNINNTTTPDNINMYSYTRDDASQADDSIQSAIPTPPALQQGLHYSIPGAFRMSTLGACMVNMDETSTVASSIRSMPPQPPRDPSDDYAVEARLVEDGLTLASTTNSSATDVDEHDYCLEDLPNDEPMPPPPCTTAQYTISMGGNTVSTFGTTRSLIVEAEPIDEHHALRAFFSNKMVQFVLCVLILVFLVLAVGTTYGVTGFAGNFDDPTDPPKSGDQEGDIDSETTVAPTLDATIEGDLDLSYFVHDILPKATKMALVRDDSAQSKALRWLRHNNTHLLSYSTGQRLQRFSLATFFYATGGERKWRSRTGWLTDADECEWFTTANTTVCKNGMYHKLSLGVNGLRGTIPPELDFLTALSLLEAPGNVLTGSIPSNVGMMTNLRELSLCKWWGGGVCCNRCLYCACPIYVVANHHDVVKS